MGTKLAIGHPTTFVGARSLNQAAILDAIRSRRVFVADNAGLSVTLAIGKAGIGEEVTASGRTLNASVVASSFPRGATLKLISGTGTLRDEIISVENFSRQFEIDVRSDSYIRLEVRGENKKMLGFTNPILSR